MGRILSLSLFFCCFSTLSPASEIDLNVEPDSAACESPIVKAKRDYYSQKYPDILFVILTGGNEAVTDMIALDTLLGPEPTSLDYEHPEDLREALMLASAERLWLMLQYQLPSASLYRADQPLGWQDTICVITLDACEIASTNVGATSFLLDLPAETVKGIPEHLLLDKNDYIKYTFDHEAYHCLKSKLIGPQKMSSHALYGEYTHYKDEKAADAYALAMHIRDNKRKTEFVDNVGLIRGMSLYNADPDHFTCDAITELKKIPASRIVKMSDQQIFDLANKIRQDLTGSYEEYLVYLASAIEAIRLLAVDSEELMEFAEKLEGVKPDPGLVRILVDRSRSCRENLEGNGLLDDK
jgi:hypothetical protein